MKNDQKVNGLNPRHVAQIVRRNGITKVTPSGKVYRRRRKDWSKADE